MGLGTFAKACIACEVCTAVVHAAADPKMTMTGFTASIDAYDPLPDCLGCSLVTANFAVEQASRVHTKWSPTPFVMHLPEGPGIFGNRDASNLGWFTMPEQIAKPGTNQFEVDSNFTVPDPQNFVYFGLSLTMNPHFHMSIVGSPKVTVRGSDPITLKLGKDFNCTFVEEEWQGSGLHLAMKCDQMRDLDDDEIDSILESFDQDMAAITPAATTTAATTMALGQDEHIVV